MERIRLIDPADPRFGDAFALYEISFPVYERRTRAAQAARLSHPEYHFDLLMEGERFLGILLFWEADGFRYPRGAGDRPAPGRGLHPAAAFL